VNHRDTEDAEIAKRKREREEDALSHCISLRSLCSRSDAVRERSPPPPTTS
jgi:hypothetical protein